MKQFNFLKSSLLASGLLIAGAANAQVVHPLAFGSQTIGGTATPSNWYLDYVSVRFEVVSPSALAGDKQYKTANDGSGSTAEWAGPITTPIVNLPLVMPQAGDSLATTAISVNMIGKVAFIYRGSNEFGFKALQAQNAGATACVIVNNETGGPVGMAAGASGATVTIPVFMISKEDGDLLDASYNTGVIPHVTITTWGQGYQNDLGFIPGGTAGWHTYAIPKSQLAETTPVAYMGLDGAFIGNFGSHPATHVKVSGTLDFTPNGGSATQLHTDTTAVLATFNQADSIYSMFAPSAYNIPSQGGVAGRYDLTYHIISDSSAVDQFPSDNVSTYSFYATDSVFSKGRYDFTNKAPLSTIYESFGSGTEFIWGPTYFVANAGLSVSKVQYSIAMNVATGASNVLSGSNNVYLFKWTDGRVDSFNSISFPLDSIMQNGELELISLGVKNYDGINDTSDALLTTPMGDSNGNAVQIPLEANSWYYLAVDVPSSTGTPLFLGADGILDPFPRVYGFFMNNGILDYSNVVASGSALTDVQGDPSQGNSPSPVTATAFLTSVDSFNYNNAKGLIPSVAMITKPTTVGVKNVNAKPFADVTLYPNPASNYITVSIDMQQTAKTVTYELMDGLGRFVSKEVHNNIQSEKNVMSTANLAAGNYYLIINADNKVMSRKFTVIK